MANLSIIENSNYPTDLCCPISKDVMIEPVMMSDGHTYDKENIEKWLQKNNKSPLTNEILKPDITINYNLKKLIEDHKENNTDEIKREFYLDNNCAKYKDNDELINGDMVRLIHSDFTYKGPIINGELSGNGIYIWSNNEKYQGEIKKNKKHGKGIMTYENGDIYEGQWNMNERNGKGIMTYKNGDIYDGEWENDEKSGKGIMNYENGDIYDGNWLFDKRNFKGIMTYENSEIYNGDWEDDKKHGNGIMTYNNFSEYNGEWKDDKKHGKGTLKNIKEEKYDGYWLDDKKHGAFEIHWPGGNSLKCNFINDKVNGKAIIKSNYGKEIYDGEIDENLNKHGKGTMEYQIKFNKISNKIYKKYIGEWDKNLKKGKGIMEYVNGDIYIGEWKDNFRNGKGILKNKSEEYFYKGNWYEGEIIKNGEIQVYTKFNGKFTGKYKCI
tara:strand:- start:39 stop:1355 length:1317 start_codon:yes stop_codon:yes gene_type:complete